jgi:hypothetical protein
MTNQDLANLPREMIEVAAQDEEVRTALRAVMKNAITKAQWVLSKGTPDRQDKMISLLIAPAVKAMLSDKADGDTDARGAYHQGRRMISGMLGLEDDDTDADASE